MKKGSESIQPLGEKILVSKEVKEVTESGFILPVSSSGDGTNIGKVIAVGEGRRLDNGSLQPMSVKPGQKILYSWGDKVEVNGEEYHIVSESSVLAVVK